MRHRGRRNFDEDYETKKIIYITIAVIGIAILAFGITFAVYSNKLGKEIKQGEFASKITDLSTSENNESSQASSMIGKNVNEVQKENTNENTTKIAINTSKVEQTNTQVQTNTDVKNTNSNTTSNTITNTAKETKEEKKEELKFIKPVEGETVREFAKEKLVYSETLKEWITHNGIDIKAEKKTIVKASEKGIVKSIKNDPRYGITVVIEHEEGYVTVYSNLLTAEFVKEGEKVESGQTIGTVGNTAAFEVSDEPHLHFEMLKDNEYIDPSLYIK